MTPHDRQNKIVNIIRERNHITVDELAKFLSVSRETIRRDLTTLTRIGKVQQCHGGASLPIITEEGPFQEPMSENVAAKVQIADEAVKLVSPGETIFIDTGSTTLYFAEKLAELSNLTVITNSGEIARIISLFPMQPQVFMLGGKFNGDNRQTYGNLVISQAQFFRAHHVILTVGVVNAITGIMDFNFEEAQIAQAMIEQAESLTVLADYSKFGGIASFKVCDLDQVTNLVCNQCPPDEIKSALLEANVNIICVNS